KNFGRQEGLVVAQLLDKSFGKLWSLRRIILSGMLFTALILFRYFWLRITDKQDLACYYCGTVVYPIFVSISIVGFCLSVSLTKLITLRMAYLCGAGALR